MTARSRDFRATSAFAAGAGSAVRGLEHAFTIAGTAVGARRLLSTPSRGAGPRAWLGVGSVAGRGQGVRRI
ncbi:Hypothetical protein I596_1490 [Dokdonella koreensis DS-123]|uniref:Uncharacterized protein n=1 Tax=Dokdonella koreensis DS-123 TaxID=1300342 RepID=A0A167GT86_9GAMM|nr:Hypothetical protein I596_1490 [Dokdonella koreensis DS-123]